MEKPINKVLNDDRFVLKFLKFGVVGLSGTVIDFLYMDVQGEVKVE